METKEDSREYGCLYLDIILTKDGIEKTVCRYFGYAVDVSRCLDCGYYVDEVWK